MKETKSYRITKKNKFFPIFPRVFIFVILDVLRPLWVLNNIPKAGFLFKITPQSRGLRFIKIIKFESTYQEPGDLLWGTYAPLVPGRAGVFRS